MNRPGLFNWTRSICSKSLIAAFSTRQKPIGINKKPYSPHSDRNESSIFSQPKSHNPTKWADDEPNRSYNPKTSRPVRNQSDWQAASKYQSGTNSPSGSPPKFRNSYPSRQSAASFDADEEDDLTFDDENSYFNGAKNNYKFSGERSNNFQSDNSRKYERNVEKNSYSGNSGRNVDSKNYGEFDFPRNYEKSESSRTYERSQYPRNNGASDFQKLNENRKYANSSERNNDGRMREYSKEYSPRQSNSSREYIPQENRYSKETSYSRNERPTETNYSRNENPRENSYSRSEIPRERYQKKEYYPSGDAGESGYSKKSHDSFSRTGRKEYSNDFPSRKTNCNYSFSPNTGNSRNNYDSARKPQSFYKPTGSTKSNEFAHSTQPISLSSNRIKQFWPPSANSTTPGRLTLPKWANRFDDLELPTEWKKNLAKELSVVEPTKFQMDFFRSFFAGAGCIYAVWHWNWKNIGNFNCGS